MTVEAEKRIPSVVLREHSLNCLDASFYLYVSYKDKRPNLLAEERYLEEERLERELRAARLQSRRGKFIALAVGGLLFLAAALRGIPLIPLPFLFFFFFIGSGPRSRVRVLENRLRLLRDGKFSAVSSKVDREAVSKESATFRAAKERGGILTPVLLSMDSGMNIEAAERTLDSLAKRGYIELEVSSEGKLFYVFPEFKTEEGAAKLPAPENSSEM